MRRLVLALALALAAMSTARAAPDDAALAGADAVLLGEIHDDPAHHRAQAAVIDRLVALGRPPAVVLEMVSSDLQPALDAARTGGGGADGLAAAVAWEERWGDFDLYRPVIEAALRHDLRIVAGDLPDDLRRLVARRGPAALPDPERRRLGLDVPLDGAPRAALVAALVEGHCGMDPGDRLAAMVDVQRARDGSLADAVLRAAEEGAVVLIAGQGHVRRDFGVPRLLAARDPDLDVLAVALAADGSDPGPGFDMVVPTGPAPARDDPCAGLPGGG